MNLRINYYGKFYEIPIQSCFKIITIKYIIKDYLEIEIDKQILFYNNYELYHSDRISDFSSDKSINIKLYLKNTHEHNFKNGFLNVELNGNIIKLNDISSSDNILSIKEKIFRNYFIPIVEQNIIYLGKKCLNKDLIYDLGITNNSLIHLFCDKN